MRPLKLTMSAFGPYAEQHTIDFTTLKEKNIFLITGPTGAGKTTVFDAISYALFGEASGSSRDKDSLRSDFAAFDIQTFVELEFELREKKYIVNRAPQQELKKARGEGTVLRNAEASLILPSGDIVTRVTPVDNKMAEILGINKNQFRQIVMLPQGEFRKLLESDSQEREGIFRKIFSTETFEAVQRKLIFKRKFLSDKINEAITQRNTHAKHIVAEDEVIVRLLNAKDLNILEIINRTEELIEKDKLISEALNKEIKDIKAKQEALQRHIFEANENNKKLIDKTKLAERYISFKARESEYENKELKLKNGRKALEVKTVEDYLRELAGKLKEKKEQYFNSEKKLAECTNYLKLCKEQLDREEANQEQIKKLSDIRSQLISKENRVKEYEERNSKIEDCKKELEQNAKALDQFKKKIEIEKEELAAVTSELKKAQNAELQREKLSKTQFESKNLIENINELLKHIERFNFLTDKHKKLSLEFKNWDGKYQNYKTQVETKEENFKRGQAGFIALDLVEGAACPVCGSTTHPSLAKKLEDVPTEEELKKLKERLQLLTDERQRKYDVLTELYGQISSMKSTIPDQIDKLVVSLGEELDKISIEKLPNYLTAKLKIINNDLAKITAQQAILNKLIDKKQTLQNKEQALNESIKNCDGKIEILFNKEKDLYGKVKSEEEFLQGIENEVPAEIRSYAKLSFKINELGKNIKAMEDSYKKALDDFSSAEKAEASSAADKKAKYDIAVESQKEVNSYKQQLKDKIEAAGFENYEKYTTLKMSEEEIKSLEKDINQYYQELKAAEEMLKQAEVATSGFKEVVIDDLLETSEKNKKELKDVEEKDKIIYTRINNNRKALDEINSISELIKEDEEQYGIIAEIANVANGDNQQRITFERYVLAAYFDEIIDAANTRLDKMAGGRFILKRKEEKGKGRKQEGLELEVFDNYTGKARHVKTLSGGESFKASLALALGLADVVQSHAGGISLDTMFVDEGFGTLDPESLDTAIKCLIDLQENGRLVGIISHVPELKERIDARLEITTAKEGSRARFVI